MELKPYQQHVLDDLELYLEYVQEDKDYVKAFKRFWEDKNRGVQSDSGNQPFTIRSGSIHEPV